MTARFAPHTPRPLRATTVLTLALVGLLAAQALPATVLLFPDGSGTYPTIQAALTAAANGDSIMLANGTYQGYGNRDLDFLGKALVLMSLSGDPELCIIDCQGTNVTPHRGVYFHSGETESSILKGITITNGWSPISGANQREDSGAAIRCVSSSPTIVACRFVNNWSAFIGGAITTDINASNIGSSPRIIDCYFANNSAPSAGGAIAIIDEGLHSSRPSVIGCHFVGNTTDMIGGAIYVHWTGVVIQDCIFNYNIAGDSGGALYRRGCPDMAPISNCIFINNAAGDGGGIALYREGHTTLESCTFFGNIGMVAPFAAIVPLAATMKVPIDAQPMRNPVGTASCVCTYLGATADLSRCIMSFSPEGPAVDNPYDGGIVTITDCDVFGNVEGPGIVSNQIGVNGNIAQDPRFCDGANGNLNLWSDSPCAAENSSGVRIGALGIGCYVPVPWQLLITDAPADQGGFLICSWGRHTNDLAGQSPLVTYYELQRQDAAWTFLSIIAAAQADSYSVTIATPDILTIGQTVVDHDYRLIARTVDPATNFVTESVAAVSIDNVSPLPPVLELFDSETYRYLNWDDPSDADFAETCLHRWDAPGIEGGDPLVCSATPFWYQEAHLGLFWYRARSYDIHGNASEWSNEVVGRYPTAVPGPLPTVLRLYPNQPNPFNPLTTLRFDLPVGGRVHLEVYDVAGRLIRTLLDVELPAGSHQAVWDGKDERGTGVASGTYFARLSASGKVETVRMGLVR